MAIKESDIRGLFKVITSETMKTVSAGQKTIISPTTIRNIAAEVTQQAESGSTKQFMQAFDKVEKIIDKLGVNVSDFNKGLGKRIEELRTQRDTSAKEVEKLRADNIASETRVIEKDGQMSIQTSILTKKEIKTRQREIIMVEKTLLREEKEAQKRKEQFLKQETLSQDDNERILADEENIVRIQEDIQNKKDSLGVETGGQRERGASSTFLQTLMEPFTAVGDALLSVRDIANSVTDVFSFFADGGLTKSLKKFKGGLKAIGKFFGSTKVLIGIAIAGVLLLMYKFRDKIGDVASAIMKIPGKIFDFFKGIFVMIKDFFIKMINGVIKLLNKVNIFGDDMALLETSKDKKENNEELELKAKETREANALMNEGDVSNEEKKQLEELKQPNEKIMPDKKFSLEEIETGKVDYSKVAMSVDDRKNINTASGELTAKANQSPVVIQNNSTQNNTSSSGQTQNYVHTDNKNSDPTLLNMNNTAIA
jgi:hypothetical protein